MLNPKELESLKKLEAKIGKKLQEVPLTDIPEGVDNGYSGDEEGNMTGLNLYDTDTSDISFLRDFRRLTYLNLGDNQISGLWPIQKLTHLTVLDLSGNHISDISPLHRLIHLTALDLSGNQISDISPLHKLTHLIALDLSVNQISDLSPLQTLINLTQLNLGENQVSDIAPLQALINLTDLRLENNQISELFLIQPLINLTQLSLWSNQFSDISPLLTLKKLQHLDVRNNKISRLHAEWTTREIKMEWEYTYGDGLFLKGNPLESPPVEIVQQGTAAVRNYFKEIEKETVLLLQSKLLLVGSGAVGKTTLVKKLQNPNFKVKVGLESTTRGIDIFPWELTCTFAHRESHPVKILCWDFGGQDILYSTHQFFLTKRSLYLFVWEARQENQETASFDYWLNIINLLSASSPVIVVMNKADTRTQLIDEASFKAKFPNIRAFIQVSCLTGSGITELTELIRAGLSDMPHLLDRLPKTWLQIRDDLKSQNKDYITRADYLAICEKRGLVRERAGFLSEYLHDLGTILYFSSDPLLADTVILNPGWATAAVYKIIDAPAIQQNKGRFQYEDLKTYWDPGTFPSEKHPHLLRLMERFELCFPVLGTKDNIHIVPELLPPQQPIDMDRAFYKGPGSLRFEYHYEFMPRGILSRFITRLYYLIRGERFWRNGVELALDNTYALVVSEPLLRKLTVTVIGPGQSELLAVARDHLDYIHRTLNMNKDDHYREMIPCRCDTCRTAKNPHLFRHELLKRCMYKGIPTVLCEVSLEKVPTSMLLKGYALSPQITDLTELLPALITTAARLQGRAKAIRPDEDSRNTFIAEILSARGFIVKNQTHWGSSSRGIRPGELDFLVETPDGNAVSIIEAFILKGMHRGVIAAHFNKIFAYDALGLENNFLIVYVENADFGTLWREYLKYLPDVEVAYPMQGAPVEEKTPYAGIKLARTVHNRHNRETAVYHLFINMTT
jgi:internalin A